MLFKIFTIVGEMGQVFDFDAAKRKGQGHVTKAMMVAISFPVGGNVA